MFLSLVQDLCAESTKLYCVFANLHRLTQDERSKNCLRFVRLPLTQLEAHEIKRVQSENSSSSNFMETSMT